MIGDPSYALLSTGLSVVIVVIAGRYVRTTAARFARWKDYRAGHAYMLAVLGFVIALGLLVSSIGVIVSSEALIVGGQSIARGALVTVGLALLGAPEREDQ